MDILIGLALTVVFVALGFFAGSAAERKHFAHLAQKEYDTQAVIQTNSKQFLAPSVNMQLPPTMVVAETVIASDYFKNFLSQFRKFFGGELRSYHSLMDRARRETTVRLLETARSLGYNAICNVRLETADVGGKTMVMVAILGSATAYHSSIQVEIQPGTSQPVD